MELMTRMTTSVQVTYRVMGRDKQKGCLIKYVATDIIDATWSTHCSNVNYKYKTFF